MSLPRQLQAQAAEVERIEAELASAQTAQTPTPPEPTPLAEPPVTTTQTPAEPPKAPTPAPAAEPTVDWQQKYSTLQGMFNAQANTLKEVQAQLATLQSAATPTPTPAPAPTTPLVTDKDVEAFGSDLLDVVKRQAIEAARAEFGDQLEGLKADNAKLREQLGGVAERQVTNDRDRYWKDLKDLVPDYEQQNVDAGFVAWINEVDPLSGAPRSTHLKSAYDTFDVARTAALFKAYKQPAAPAPTPTPTTEPSDLERQVAPGTSKSGSEPPTDTAHKIWTTAEIDQFYRDCSRGAFKGTAADKAKVEAEIDLAVAQGRVKV